MSYRMGQRAWILSCTLLLALVPWTQGIFLAQNETLLCVVVARLGPTLTMLVLAGFRNWFPRFQVLKISRYFLSSLLFERGDYRVFLILN